MEEWFETASPEHRELLLQLVQRSQLQNTLLLTLNLQQFLYDESVVYAVEMVAARIDPSELSEGQILTCVAHVLVQARLFACSCLSTSELHLLVQAVLHLLVHSERLTIPCSVILECLVFFQYENRFPTQSEQTVFHTNSLFFERDAMDYTTTEVPPQPERALLLPITPGEETDHICGICQEEIVQGTAVYKLSCHHSFHAEDCLGPNTVIHWLSTNVTCPVCRDIVHF